MSNSSSKAVSVLPAIQIQRIYSMSTSKKRIVVPTLKPFKGPPSILFSILLKTSITRMKSKADKGSPFPLELPKKLTGEPLTMIKKWVVEMQVGIQYVKKSLSIDMLISIFNILLEDNTHNMTFNPTIHAFISNNKGNNESSYFNPLELLKESKKKNLPIISLGLLSQ